MRGSPQRPAAWRGHLHLLGVLVRLSIQDDAAYRAEFFAQLFNALYGLATGLVGLWVFFSQTPTLGGWSIEQILVLIGVFNIMSGLVRATFAPNLTRLSDDVRTGTLDFVLTKPVSSQFLVSFRRIAIPACADALMGFALVAYGAWRLPALGLGQALAFVVAIICSAAILYAFWLALTTLVFWFVRIDNLTQVFWALFEAGKYPVSIYPQWLRWLLTYLVPVGLVTTWPARVLSAHLAPAELAGLALAALLALLAAHRFWRFGIRHYTSASS